MSISLLILNHVHSYALKIFLIYRFQKLFEMWNTLPSPNLRSYDEFLNLLVFLYNKKFRDFFSYLNVPNKNVNFESVSWGNRL